MTDTDGRGHRFRVIDHCAAHKGCRTGRLVADHGRPFIGHCLVGIFALACTEATGRRDTGTVMLGILAITNPVGSDIAGITNRQTMEIRRPAQFINNFKRRSLLPLQTIGVD